MGNQPPFRMPCEGVSGTPRYFWGAPFQHQPLTDKIDKYLNTTTVPDWHTPPGAAIAPYQRPNATSLPACAPTTPTCDASHVPCGPWMRPFPGNTYAHTPGDQVDFALSHKRGFKNVFARRFFQGRVSYMDAQGSGGIDTLQPCSSATTFKSWLSAQAGTTRTRYTRINASSHWHTEAPVGHAVTSDETASCQETIDKYSGIGSPDSYSVSPNDQFSNALAQLAKAFWKWPDIVNFFTSFWIDTTGWDITYTSTSAKATSPSDPTTIGEEITFDLASGSFSRTVYNFIACSTWGPIWAETLTVTDTTIDYEYSSQNGIGTGGRYSDETSDLLTLSVTGTLSLPVQDTDVVTDAINMLASWNLADDKQYPFRTDRKVSLGPLMQRDETRTTDFSGSSGTVQDFGAPFDDGTGTIGDAGWDGRCGILAQPNASTGTYITAIDFPSADGSPVDIQVNNPFPWCGNTLTFTVIGGSFPSGVSMDASGHITGTIGDSGHWGVTIQITGAVPQFSGAIQGAPNPAGYQDYFDFDFLDYRGCCYTNPTDGVSSWDWYVANYGMKLSDFNSLAGCAIPLTATKWTNFWQGQNKPIGAGAFYNDPSGAVPSSCLVATEAGYTALDASALWLCKYAEIIEGWNSENFARPAGTDKFAYDETMVACATNVSGSGAGSEWALIDPATGVAPTFIGTTGLWGGPSVGGFYELSAWDGTNVTLGTKIYDVPSNWHSRSNGDDSQAFGMLRFTTGVGDPDGLLGRAAVTSSGTTFTFASAQPTFGMLTASHQEQVDVYDASMTLLASNVTATRIDDSNFSLPASHATAAWVTITGIKYYFNDNQPKGDFAILETVSDFRSKGEATRLNGTLDCSGAQVTVPTTNVGGGNIDFPYASFSQTASCLPFVPCAPKVVCITPNGETFPNGQTFAFPAITLDEQYGWKWWGYVQSTMTDIFWQPPHRPCNLGTCDSWKQDDGTCQANTGLGNDCPADPATLFYEFPPQVEARLDLPSNYGIAMNETPPALPTGIQLGWLSPVTHNTGDVAYPPTAPGPSGTGEPSDDNTPWSVHSTLCANATCVRFNYSTPQC